MDEKIMFARITQKVFDLMFEMKLKHLGVVTEQFSCSMQGLHDTLWEEFNIPGMEIRIANTAFNFLIGCCERKEDLEDTLKGEIRKDILYSSIYYSNVAPDAINTDDFREQAQQQ